MNARPSHSGNHPTALRHHAAQSAPVALERRDRAFEAALRVCSDPRGTVSKDDFIDLLAFTYGSRDRSESEASIRAALSRLVARGAGA